VIAGAREWDFGHRSDGNRTEAAVATGDAVAPPAGDFPQVTIEWWVEGGRRGLG